MPSPSGFPHPQAIELFGARPAPAAPAAPLVPIFSNWEPPARPPRARLVATAEQGRAAEAAAQRAALQPDPHEAAMLARARDRLEDARHAEASVVHSDSIAASPRQLW